MSSVQNPFNLPVLLAPMAGITDAPFRDLVANFGAGLVVSEMVASQEIVQAKRDARTRAALGRGRTAVQLAGREVRWLTEAAKLVAGEGARIIDLNMGCPAKRVTSGWSGSALMREPDHALRLIEAVVGAVDVPVTVKMRLGWDSLTAPNLAARAADAGVAWITVHGRTRCQFYKGSADWRAIAHVTRAVPVPVIANGDIVDAGSARAALRQSEAAAVMVGRGAQGAPWRLAEIAHALGHGPAPTIPLGPARAALVIAHHEAMLSHYGRDLGQRVARKHLGWYLDHSPCAPELRRQILTQNDPATTHALLARAFADAPEARAA